MHKIMGYIIVLLIVAFMVYMAKRGSRRGIIKLLYTIVSIIVCMTISSLLTEPVTSFLKKDTGLYKAIHSSVDDYVRENIEMKSVQSIASASGQIQTEDILESIDDSSILPKQLMENIVDMDDVTGMADKGSEQLMKYIVNAISEFLLHIIVSLCIIIIMYMILFAVGKSLNFVSRLPVIHEVNKASGYVIGIVEGVVMLWLFCLLLSFCTTTEYGSMLIKVIEQNVILSNIYNTSISLFSALFYR